MGSTPPTTAGAPRAHARRAPAASRLALVILLASVTGAAAPLAAAQPAARVEVRPEAPVTAMDLGVGWANNSPTLAADPGDPRFVVLASRLDAPDFSCALHVSGNGGRSWTPVNPVPELPAGAEKCYAPEVAFDGAGNLYYLFVGLHGRGNEPMGAFITTSKDRGRTFSAPRRVLGPHNFSVRMAIDRDGAADGRVHLAWLHATSDPPLGGFGPPPNPIMAAYSDNGGATFSKPVQVSDAERERVVAPALALGPDGAVHVGYYDLEDDAVDYQGLEGPRWDGTWSLVVATSTDGGKRFAPGVVVDDSIGPPERVMLIFTMPPPALVAGPGDRVCAAWTDARHGDPDVLIRCSADTGRTWGGQARRVNDDRTGNGASQYLPRLSVAPGGRLDAIFYDRRGDPQNLQNHVFFTFSTDGGRRFAPNARVTGEPSSTDIGQRYLNPSAQGRYEIGSRLGLLSRPTAAVAAWTDTRNNPRPGTTGQDVFATTIAVPAGRDAGLARPGVLAAALPVLAAVAGLAWWRLRRRRRRSPAEAE